MTNAVYWDCNLHVSDINVDAMGFILTQQGRLFTLYWVPRSLVYIIGSLPH